MSEALDKDVYLPLVRSALAEDVGSGDVTTMSLIDQDSFASGVIVAKEPLVVDFIRSSMFGVLKDSAYFVNTLNFSFSIFSNPILKTVFEDELESES